MFDSDTQPEVPTKRQRMSPLLRFLTYATLLIAVLYWLFVTLTTPWSWTWITFDQASLAQRMVMGFNALLMIPLWTHHWRTRAYPRLLCNVIILFSVCTFFGCMLAGGN